MMLTRSARLHAYVVHSSLQMMMLKDSFFGAFVWTLAEPATLLQNRAWVYVAGKLNGASKTAA
jgi:hypothetical protein